MSDIWQTLVAAMHDSQHQIVLAVTGGGSSAISQLLGVPGASRSVLEAIVPYADTSLSDWLGCVSEQACSEATARTMAMASWMRARTLAPECDPHRLIGVGATASLVSDRPKKGDHRIHVATQTDTATATYSLILAKDQRDRTTEETVAAQLILVGLAQTCQVDVSSARSILNERLTPKERIESAQTEARGEWAELLLGKTSSVRYPIDFEPQALLCGAFNPPHQGHRRMAAHAADRLGCPVSYELSITNVDKPPLDFKEIDTRLRNLQCEPACEQVLLTDAPTFRAKSALFPGCTFVVGADTIARVGDEKYYTGAEGSFDEAIRQIADRSCRFLVFGRQLGGSFQTLSDLALPPALHALCDEVTSDEFREDVSSTQLRIARDS